MGVASRIVDMKCGQYFYDDGSYTRYWDGEGLSQIDTGQHPFWAKVGTIGAVSQGATSLTYTPSRVLPVAPVQGDTLTLDFGNSREQVTINGAVTPSGTNYTCPIPATAHSHGAGTLATTFQIKLAFFENEPLAQWTTVLDGDGITPPTNYFFWPRNRPTAGSSANPSAYRPFWGVDIARIPISSTPYLPSSIPGYFTIQMTAQWGWPAVPDVVKDIVCKLTARAWRARAAGWAVQIGSPDIGVVDMSRFFDSQDMWALKSSDLVHTYL